MHSNTPKQGIYYFQFTYKQIEDNITTLNINICRLDRQENTPGNIIQFIILSFETSFPSGIRVTKAKNIIKL